MDDRRRTEGQYEGEEAERRFQALLKAAVNTPPAPMKDRAGRKGAGKDQASASKKPK